MTSALHAEGPRFDPGIVYAFCPGGPQWGPANLDGAAAGSHRRASIAQMVERKTLNLVVVGSIPTGGALLPFAFGAGAIGCPWGPVALIPSAALAQLGERQTEDLKVPGSIPGGGTFC